MKDLQSIFNRIQEKKKEMKDIKGRYQDALINESVHESLKEKIKKLREQKKEIESVVQAQMGRDYERLEDLKYDMDSDKELLSDMALTQLMDGKPLEVSDEKENEYEPVIKVTFKKQ